MTTKEQDIPNIDICTLSEYRQEDLMVSRLAPYLQIHKDLVFPHRHNFYQFVWFLNGNGTHTIDFYNFTVKPFQIYFMTPGQVHTWDFDDWVDGYVVNFSSDFFQSFLLRPDYVDTFSFWKGNTEDSVMEISENRERLIGLFEDLFVHSSAEFSVMKGDMIRLLLLQIFILIEQTVLGKQNARRKFVSNSVIQNFQKLIERNFTTIRLPGEYAELLNVTTNHLNALSKEHLGKQAGEVIRDRIILEAKRMLVSLDLTVLEIAYKLNFNDNSYFTKFFKKVTGVTPEEFRKKFTSE